MNAAVLHKILSPAECKAVAKSLGLGAPLPTEKTVAGAGAQEPAFNLASGPETPAFHQDAGNPVARKPALSSDVCATCGTGEFGIEADRVTVDYSDGTGRWVPCPECRMKTVPCPPPEGIERRDSWDLASEELVMTAQLPLDVPAYWGRPRDDWDEHDDKSDLAPWAKTTRY